MDKQETIKQLELYIKALQDKSNAEKEIEDLKKNMGSEVEKGDKYSLMRFYWKFLVFGPVFCVIAGLIFVFVFDVRNEASIYFFMFFALAMYCLITAGIAAKLRSNASEKLYKEQVEYVERDNNRKREKIKELEKVIWESTQFLKENKELLPVSCRNIESARTIKSKLMMGKAETVEEAINQ